VAHLHSHYSFGSRVHLVYIFDILRDVKGTAFLNFTQKVGDDDQWLYLPALKRVKRISSRNKSGSFVGSEHAYEEIPSQKVEKYTYKWIRDQVYDGDDRDQDAPTTSFADIPEDGPGFGITTTTTYRSV